MKKAWYILLLSFVAFAGMSNLNPQTQAKVTYSEKKNKQKKRYGEAIKLNNETIPTYSLLAAPKYYNMSVFVDSKNGSFKSIAVAAVKSWNAKSVLQNTTNGNGGKKADLIIIRHTNTYSRSGTCIWF